MKCYPTKTSVQGLFTAIKFDNVAGTGKHPADQWIKTVQNSISVCNTQGHCCI
jgi:hypothetical protein